MRGIVLLLFLIMLGTYAYAQRPEPVNWIDPHMFFSKKITLKTKDVKLTCYNCKAIELTTASGVTGVFLMGAGRFYIADKKMSDKFSTCLIRLNPQDYKKLVVTTPRKKLNDKAFHAASKDILKNMFVHSYHSDMNALIPSKSAYSVNFYAQKHGDIFASYDDNARIVYNFTKRKKVCCD